ncbi:hypothetical protein CBM2595_A30233 [Cupriavidus taiwanensis]|nr:hypothetical protein CBM2595_A30233 [Cupriavidus taiwanensis]
MSPMCCGSRSIGAPRFAFCWMNFQPLPKGGDARLWASFFVNAPLRRCGRLCNVCFVAKSLHAFEPIQWGRRCSPWDGGWRSRELATVKRSPVWGHMK